MINPLLSAAELNHDLKLIETWAYRWKMSFNPDPTKQAVKIPLGILCYSFHSDVRRVHIKNIPISVFCWVCLISLADLVGADIYYVEFNALSNELGVISSKIFFREIWANLGKKKKK